MLGLYPTWYEPTFGSGWVIGMIATIHLLASHTSVGAALVSLWLTRESVRQNRPQLIEYVRRYGIFLLIFSYVLGSITGPGIWFSATVASPRGLSILIHTFVWYWAVEWVFFVTEVVGIYLLTYLAGRTTQEAYLRLAWIFAGASWATMLVIVGILSFMLWPGSPEWFDEGGSLRGFYGPYTFAQIFSRTCFMIMTSALAGGLIACSFKDREFRNEMIRKMSMIGAPAAIAGSLFFQWGLTQLPESATLLLKTRLPVHFVPALWSILALIVAYFIYLFFKPGHLNSLTAATMMIALMIFGIWPEERARESMRKPFVAGQFIYSNQIIGRDVKALGIQSELPHLIKHSLLKSHPFVPSHLRNITEANQLEAGHALALVYCSNCHSLGTQGMRPFADMFSGNRNAKEIQAFLEGALAPGHMINMPQIPLSTDEARALALFISGIPLWQSTKP